MHLSAWTKTSLGTPISLSASHEWDELKTLQPILLIGGIHGDEPLGVYLAQKTLEFLNKEAQNTQPWIVVPILNVDGYKNNTRTNARGVDLNRNYPSKSWSPDCEKPRYNPGSGPGSEVEIQAVVKLVSDVKPRLIIHCHSWKPMIICAGDTGMKYANYLADSTGYEIKAEIGYPTPGSLSQYGWVDHKIPIICTEEDDLSTPKETWARFAEGMKQVFTHP